MYKRMLHFWSYAIVKKKKKKKREGTPFIFNKMFISYMNKKQKEKIKY